MSFDGSPPLRRKSCSIYGVRPLQCRTWPFWPENLASPGGVETFRQTLPRHGRRPAAFFPQANRDDARCKGLAEESADVEEVTILNSDGSGNKAPGSRYNIAMGGFFPFVSRPE